MALSSKETKTVLENIWNRVNGNPEYGYGQRAFEKLALQEYHKAVIEKQKRDEYPVHMAAE
jgi:hypothetical protein